MIIFTLDPPSKNTSLKVFLLICTWIITIRLSITNAIVLILGIIKIIVLSRMGLVLIYGLSNFNFCHKYFLRSNAILSNYPKFNV